MRTGHKQAPAGHSTYACQAASSKYCKPTVPATGVHWVPPYHVWCGSAELNSTTCSRAGHGGAYPWRPMADSIRGGVDTIQSGNPASQHPALSP